MSDWLLLRKLGQLVGVSTLLTLTISCSPTRETERNWIPESPAGSRLLTGDPTVEVPKANQTIARILPELRRCFEHLEAAGKVKLQLTIDDAGEVAAARGSGSAPRDVIHCVERKVQRAHFACPVGGRYARLDVSLRVFDQ